MQRALKYNSTNATRSILSLEQEDSKKNVQIDFMISNDDNTSFNTKM